MSLHLRRRCYLQILAGIPRIMGVVYDLFAMETARADEREYPARRTSSVFFTKDGTLA